MENETIIKENQGYCDTQDYLLNRVAEIATDECIALAVKKIAAIADLMKWAEKFGSTDDLGRSWKYTILESETQIKVTADSGVAIDFHVAWLK